MIGQKMSKLKSRAEKMEFLKQCIIELKSNSCNIDNFSEDTVLMDIGLDSLDVVELQMRYEDEVGEATADPTDVITTVGDLIDLME
jgi:acyl carrier protein